MTSSREANIRGAMCCAAVLSVLVGLCLNLACSSPVVAQSWSLGEEDWKPVWTGRADIAGRWRLHAPSRIYCIMGFSGEVGLMADRPRPHSDQAARSAVR